MSTTTDFFERLRTKHAEAVARGEHDDACEYWPEGFYLCHCSKRRREEAGFTTPPDDELYFPPPSCPRCNGHLEYDEGWTCRACHVSWYEDGSHARFTDDYGDDLAARSAEWKARARKSQDSQSGVSS